MNKSTQGSVSPSGNDSSNAAGALVGQAKDAVTHVAGRARDAVTHGIDAQKEKATDAASTVAIALRETGEKLKDVGPLGAAAEKAADGVERLSDFLQDRSLGEIVDEVEGFARREPLLFFGTAFAIGLVGGRFLKSSRRSAEGSGGDDFADTLRNGSSDASGIASTSPTYRAASPPYGGGSTSPRVGSTTAPMYSKPISKAGDKAAPSGIPDGSGRAKPSTP